MIKKTLFVGAVTQIFLTGAFINAVSARPLLICPKITSAPKIDGEIDETCWRKASHITNFLLSFELEKLASEQTEVYACCDNKNLYLAFKCHDSKIETIKAKGLDRDGNVFSDDCVEIFLDTGLTRRNYFHFVVNALGTQYDAKVTELIDTGWNIKWKSAGFIGNDFWSVELAIPFEQLKIEAPKKGQKWGVNFCRENHRASEYSCWSNTGGSFHSPRKFGDLVFSNHPGIDVRILNDVKKEKDAINLIISSQNSHKVVVVLSTISIGGEKSITERILASSQFGKIFSMQCNFVPSWQRFVFNVTIRDWESKDLLYRSPDYPLYGGLKPKLEKARNEIEHLSADIMIIKSGALKKGYILTPKQPFEVVLPRNRPKYDEIGKTICIEGAPNEFEPGTFLIYTTRNLKNIDISLTSDLKCGENVISKDMVDIRLVKVWYQAGVQNIVTKHPLLVPELLLKNDNLVFPDYKQQKNVLNFKEIPDESPMLLPFNISQYTNKQVWLIVHIPKGTIPGVYKSAIAVQPEDVAGSKIRLLITVLPIELKKTNVNYSIYYSHDSFIDKNPQRVEREIKDMKERGFTSIASYNPVQVKNGKVITRGLKRALEMRSKYGLTAPTLYVGTESTKEIRTIFKKRKNPKSVTGKEKDLLTRIIADIIKMINNNSKFPELLFYAIDEPGYDATGRALKLCGIVCQSIKKAGGKTAVAIDLNAADKLGSLLDIAILDAPTVNKMYTKKHYKKRNQLEYFYWHPLENPLHDRLRFGLVAWKTKLNGVCPFGYQQLGTKRQGWDDWGPHYRPEYYTYPTKQGFIPTIQWEGVREGIDDARYLATLEHWVNKAKSSKETPRLRQVLQEAHRLLELPKVFHNDFNTLDEDLTAKDFQNLRSQVASTIIDLKGLLKK